MAYFNVDKALEEVTDNNLIYWKITEPNNSHPLAQQREDITINKSVEQLESILRELEGGYVIIQASPEPVTGRGGDKSGIRQFRVKLPNISTGGESRGAMNGTNAAPAHFYEQLRALEVRLVEQQKNQEIADLKRQLAEQAQESPTEKIISGLLPVLVSKWGGATATPPSPPINGTDQTPGQRIQAALVRLNKLIPDLPEAMENLANYAEQNPQMLPTILNMIKPVE